MKELTRNRFELRAGIFKALAHPTRLYFVHVLGEGPRCVRELTALAGVDMSTVSRHLQKLKLAGILEDERRGTQVYYRLRTPCILKFFTCVEDTIQRQSAAQSRLARRIPPPGRKK